ncbi:hypothetical protein CASFOL_011174 [Castilleja foliolosa]|uniref:Uncharacterized protein n=1 Tax=Castilleja foliolosa TaxID=1961234 RepID=A0ABD3DYI1_9LAMI
MKLKSETDKTFGGVFARPDAFRGAVLLSVVSLLVAQEEFYNSFLLRLFDIDNQLWLHLVLTFPESGMKRSDMKRETPMKFIPEGTMSPYQDDDRFMIFTRPPKMINGRWTDFPAILIPKEDRLHEFIEEEEPPWSGRNELDFVSEPCDICGDKYGMHHWAACPLRERCRLDEEVGDDWEVVCIFCGIANCPRRCSYPFGRAAFKITKPLPYMNY